MIDLLRENEIYRERFGCLACGENHPRETICPPHEGRTTGLAWYRERIAHLTRLLAARDVVQS